MSPYPSQTTRAAETSLPTAKEDESSLVASVASKSSDDDATPVASANALSVQECDAVLETMDSLVACAEGVDAHLDYENKLKGKAAANNCEQQQQRTTGPQETTSSYFPDVNDLTICGSGEDFIVAKQLSAEVPPSTAANRPSSPPSSSLHCAICFDEAVDEESNVIGTDENSAAKKVAFAYLPCCGSEGREATSTTKICTTCIVLLSHPTSDGSARIGQCPRCRSWIAVSNEGTSIEAVQRAGKCVVCNQIKTHLVDEATCDACFLGRRCPLLYECEQCHGTQRIPHPMYRYQTALEKFGTTSWACQGRCRNFTMWRILPTQVQYVPAGDVPEAWGQDYLHLARDRVMEARQHMHESEGRGRGYLGESCVIQ